MSCNERLNTMEPRLRLKRSPPPVGLEPGTARSAGQGLTEAPRIQDIVS